jgi:hypothetical protein
MRAYLFTVDVDVRPGMRAAARLLDYLDGETTDEEQTLKDFETVKELEEKLQELPNYPPNWSPQEQEGWKLLGDALLLDDIVGDWDKWVENLPRPRLTKSLPLLRARMEQLTIDAKPAEAGSTDWFLPVRAELAEFGRRVHFQKLTLVLYWEQASQEEWQALPETARDNVLSLLKHFDTELRKKILEEIPIADRRRLEAMEQWTPEEWAKADLIEP